MNVMLKSNVLPFAEVVFSNKVIIKQLLCPLRGSYTLAVGNLTPTLSAKLWPCSKVGWCAYEVDLGQYGAVLLIQGNVPKGKNHVFLVETSEECPSLGAC